MRAHLLPTTRSRHVVRPLLTGLVAGLLLSAIASPSLALTDEEIFRSFRFSETPPGARALGRGGAFIGLADDATAMFTNPAGLGFQVDPQVLLDLSSTAYDDQAFTLTGAFELAGVTTLAPGDVLIEEEDVAAPSFVGYVQPLTDYLVIGFSRHERLNTERDTFTRYTSTLIPPFQGIALQPVATRGSFDALVDTFSVTVASTPFENPSPSG